jgi:opacity protein-like surface antigen
MKNLILALAVTFSTLCASAQNFLVIGTYDGDQEETMDKVTQNLGFGYALNDTWTLGLIQAGEDAEGETNYDLWARYNWNANTFVSVQAPTEETTDNLTVGVGYSYNVWKGLNVEPRYSMPLKEDETTGDREGTFNLGFSYKF